MVNSFVIAFPFKSTFQSSSHVPCPVSGGGVRIQAALGNIFCLIQDLHGSVIFFTRVPCDVETYLIEIIEVTANACALQEIFSIR